MNRLLTMNFGSIFSAIGDIIRDPSSNLQGSLLLLTTATLFVLILLVLGVMFIMGASDDEEEDAESEESDESSVLEPEEQVFEEEETFEAPRRPWTVIGSAVLLAVVIGIWVVAGVVTSQSSLCLGCHAGNPHAKALGKDPHSGVSCVACHEPGGVVGSVTYMVVPRGIHFVTGIVTTKFSGEYGRVVASSTCLQCHRAGIVRTVTNPAQGVKMSHAEPVAAGAQCVYCHALSDGVVSSRTVGMTPCLRCHDGHAAPSRCESCHIKDIAVAATPNPALIGPQDLIATPNCYTCHQPTKCDACHGMRLPHTDEFKLHGHARAAALDLWFNGGKTCSRCHNARHRPCQQCHGQMPSHGLSWATGHQYGDPKNCSEGCHGIKAGPSRPMCEFCHAKGIKPRPQPAAAATATVTVTTP